MPMTIRPASTIVFIGLSATNTIGYLRSRLPGLRHAILLLSGLDRMEGILTSKRRPSRGLMYGFPSRRTRQRYGLPKWS
jgi:hypothetical protein